MVTRSGLESYVLVPVQRAMYVLLSNLRDVLANDMYRTVQKIGRSGPHGRSCFPPMAHATPAYPPGSRPSSRYRSFRAIAVAMASSGDEVHSRIFFAQYILMYPCIQPELASWR